MKVFDIDHRGNIGHLVLAGRPLPVPQPSEVCIRVAAIGINRADIFQRQGYYPPPPGVTSVPGLEVSGTVIAVGSKVASVAIGAEVCALLDGGGYASHVCVKEGQVLPIPEHLSLVQAAALPEALCTVWANLFMEAKLKVKETVLVHGGSSGIGVMAVQLAVAKGITCFTTTRSESKKTTLQQLGAKLVIDTSKEDIVETVKAYTAGKGVDVILDIVGAHYFAANLSLLNPGGRLMVIALLGGGKIKEASLAPVLFKNLTVRGTTLRNQTYQRKKAIIRAVYNGAYPLLETKRIVPVIDRIFPFEQAEAAHSYMERNVHIGKIILQLG